jgi:hypothetical protein
MKSTPTVNFAEEEDDSVLEEVDKITKLRVEIAKQQSKI